MSRVSAHGYTPALDLQMRLLPIAPTFLVGRSVHFTGRKDAL
jgi:hypothetical protein